MLTVKYSKLGLWMGAHMTGIDLCLEKLVELRKGIKGLVSEREVLSANRRRRLGQEDEKLLQI